MSAFHGHIRDHPNSNPLSAAPVDRRMISPMSHAGAAGSHGAVQVSDPLTSIWGFISKESKGVGTTVHDNLTGLYHGVISDLDYLRDRNPLQQVATTITGGIRSGVNSLESFQEYRQNVFHEAGQDISGAFHAGQNAISAVSNFSPTGIIAGGVGGSFLTLAALAGLFILVKAL